MQVKSDKLYIDYLDHTVSGPSNIKNSVDRLRFDLLLFSEETLCMSVPACVKLDSTAQLLMQLTPFWDNGRIRLILDNKHRNNPWNYFNNRKRVLERGFSEQQLANHFEYIAYNSRHTNFFYNVYMKEIRQSKYELYIDKKFDTDEEFRNAVIFQVNEAFKLKRENDHSIIPNHEIIGPRVEKILLELAMIAQDRKLLFQRSAVERRLVEEFGAVQYEISIVRKILDRGFAYANGLSSYAAPLSLVTNRLTGKSFIEILKAADAELYELILNLDWMNVYRLSLNDTWLDFLDHLNEMLLLYQESEKHKTGVFSPFRIEVSVITERLVKKIYDTAMSNLQRELLKAGALIIDVTNFRDQAEKTLEFYLKAKGRYWDTIKEINSLIPQIKGAIGSLKRRYKSSTILLKEQGFLINFSVME